MVVPRRAVLTYWPNIVIAFVAVVLVGLSFETGRRAGMATERIVQSTSDVTARRTPPNWGDPVSAQQGWLRYRLYAVPIVLSHIYYGLPYDYTAYRKLAAPFQEFETSITELIAASRSIPHVEADGLYFILADDKGTVDLTRVAFRLYGIGTSSIYYLYFTIVLVSCLLYTVCYFTDVHRLALLAFLCLAFSVTVPAFMTFSPGIDVLDVRAIGMLSLVALLHILVAATDSHSTSPRQLVTTLGQALIMVFVYHIRASTGTQVLAVVAAYPLILFLVHRRDPPTNPPQRLLRRAFGAQYAKRFVPAAILLVVIGLLPVYQRLMYNPGYFGQRATLNHVLYHNLLIGLQWNPVLRTQYGLGSGDLGAAGAVDAYLENRMHSARHGWAAASMDTVRSQLPFNWVEYEDAARGLYFTIWKEQPKQCLLTLFYYHAKDVYEIVRIHLGGAPKDVHDVEFVRLGSTVNFDERHAYNPFRPLYMLVFAATTLLSVVKGGTVRPIYALITALALASALLVPIFVYAGGFVILAEAFVSAGLLIYTTLAILLTTVIVRIERGLRQPEAVGTA